MLFQDKIILGSKSPRRLELLSKICSNLEVRTKETEEIFDESMSVIEVPLHLSSLKAGELVSTLTEEETLITSDTIVVFEKKIIGKPYDKDQAMEILRNLSGNVHQVITGCTIQNLKQIHNFVEITQVHFNTITEKEINFYINQFKPMDKAGAYGIQEWIGMIGVKKIDGCFYNVMGLPVSRVYHELLSMGIK